jgi:6-pyruvoyltetrahydropterin/6-carboxytetrahydropterin synthase
MHGGACQESLPANSISSFPNCQPDTKIRLERRTRDSQIPVEGSVIAMNLTIMRRIKFCAGHRLYRHGGKCEFFHGHNYVADFYVTGDEVDDVGRVIDFADLKRLFKGWLDEHWDHGFVLNQADENGLAAVKIVEPCKYYVLPYNPTAENMAVYLLHEVCPQLLAGTGVTAAKVVLWESEESFAEASLNDSSISSGTCGFTSDAAVRN